jgi:predicted RNase H-like HicB family nuclease
MRNVNEGWPEEAAPRNVYRIGDKSVKIKCLIHEAEEGGFWAEVPSLPGCFTEGETLYETVGDLREAITCYLDGPLLNAWN